MGSLTPACTVVICTRNRPVQLEQCLLALRCLSYPNFEVLVVDNAPLNQRGQELAARFGVRYTTVPVPGLSRARNCGARASTAELVAFLDDDSVPHPDWLSALVQEFNDPRVMAVTGQIRALRIETEAERICALLFGLDSGGCARRVVDRDTPSWFELANFGGVGMGGNMAFRRSAFEVWPGFEERLGMGGPVDGGEEHYAFFQLIAQGYRVAYTPESLVFHPFPSTMDELRAWQSRKLAAATAYFTFLLAEEPRYRGRTLKYILEGVAGRKRTWRSYVADHPPRILSHWSILLARLSGPLLYLRARTKRRA